MKKLLITLLFACVALPQWGVPALPGVWRTLTLTDGSTVRAQLWGDEYGSAYVDADGAFYAAAAGGFERIDRPTLQTRRRANMDAQGRPTRMATKAYGAPTWYGLGVYGQSGKGIQSVGAYSIPVILVEFSDKTFQDFTTVELMERYFNEENFSTPLLSDKGIAMPGSVRDYFVAQSGGLYAPTFDVVGKVKLSKSYTYYGAKTDTQNDAHVLELPRDAVAAAVEQLGTNFAQYALADNAVPLVAIIYAGEGQASGGDDDTVWPCQYFCEETMSDTYFHAWFVGNEYAKGNIIRADLSADTPVLTGIGTFCHEFGHALGLPDFYCTDGSYDDVSAFGFWSVMNTGCWEGMGYAPVGYLAYERNVLGWLELPEIAVDEAAHIDFSTFGGEGACAWLLRHPSDERQFYILERREPGTWYPENYGSGLLATRFAYDASVWGMAAPNNDRDALRACAVSADGGAISLYAASPAHLLGGDVSLCATWPFADGNNLSVGLFNIEKDGADVVPAARILLNENFGGCVGKQHKANYVAAADMVSTKFVPDCEGWQAKTTTGGWHCAVVGKHGRASSATSPAFALNGAAATVWLVAASSSDTKSVGLTLAADGAALDIDSVSLGASGWQTVRLRLTPTSATDSVRLTLSAADQFLLKSLVVVADADVSAISAPTAAKAAAPHVFGLDGRRRKAVERGINIVGGKTIYRKNQ